VSVQSTVLDEEDTDVKNIDNDEVITMCKNRPRNDL